MLTPVEIFLICCINASKPEIENAQKAVKFLCGLIA